MEKELYGGVITFRKTSTISSNYLWSIYSPSAPESKAIFDSYVEQRLGSR